MENRKPIIVYLPEDADVVSIVVTRQIPVEQENGEVLYQNGLVAGCFNAVADAYDAFTGNSFAFDMENNKWVVLESDEDEPLMPDNPLAEKEIEEENLQNE